MRFRTRFAASGLFGLFCVGVAFASDRIGEHFWPTPNDAFLKGRSLSHFVQPTQSGRWESGLWGCVRNQGSRFHEGIDLSSISRDRRGEAIDSVYAFDEGVVRYVNRSPDKSSYGRYVVIEHPQWMPGMVTLYAHLSRMPSRVAPGLWVKGGEPVATMGRSASYAIPKARAHLHFEVGLWLGPNFRRCYERQSFKTPNDHQDYNGMNLVGLDVWGLLQSLRSGETRSVMEYIASRRRAVSVTIWDDGIPDLLQANPELMANDLLPANHAGWRIDFAASGLPLRFEALSGTGHAASRKMTVEALQPGLALAESCAALIRPGANGGASPRLISLLDRLFGD